VNRLHDTVIMRDGCVANYALQLGIYVIDFDEKIKRFFVRNLNDFHCLEEQDLS